MKTKNRKTGDCKFIHCKKLGTPKTAGSLAKLLKRYKPRTGFGFRNQPIQSLYELKYSDETFVVFQ